MNIISKIINSFKPIYLDLLEDPGELYQANRYNVNFFLDIHGYQILNSFKVRYFSFNVFDEEALQSYLIKLNIIRFYLKDNDYYETTSNKFTKNEINEIFEKMIYKSNMKNFKYHIFYKHIDYVEDFGKFWKEYSDTEPKCELFKRIVLNSPNNIAAYIKFLKNNNLKDSCTFYSPYVPTEMLKPILKKSPRSFMNMIKSRYYHYEDDIYPMYSKNIYMSKDIIHFLNNHSNYKDLINIEFFFEYIINIKDTVEAYGVRYIDLMTFEYSDQASPYFDELLQNGISYEQMRQLAQSNNYAARCLLLYHRDTPTDLLLAIEPKINTDDQYGNRSISFLKNHPNYKLARGILDILRNAQKEGSYD